MKGNVARQPVLEEYTVDGVEPSLGCEHGFEHSWLEVVSEAKLFSVTTRCDDFGNEVSGAVARC